jgi:hypothetical protein
VAELFRLFEHQRDEALVAAREDFGWSLCLLRDRLLVALAWWGFRFGLLTSAVQVPCSNADGTCTSTSPEKIVGATAALGGLGGPAPGVLRFNCISEGIVLCLAEQGIVGREAHP